ncbi:MAG: dihydrofolate reductase family protein [Actinomycetota bacterium]|nr:dihydrofolate reductase family protein [Actinomycetota bacterium]
MRVLIGPDGHDLEQLYAAPEQPWLRVNMITTLDGAATGESGKSGTINNAADKRVFDTLRGLAEAVIVGAGTARTEGYRPGGAPIVVVSRRGEVPPTLRGAEPGRVLMATCTTAPHLDEGRELLGSDHVLTFGSHRVDLAELRRHLVDRGWRDLLSEGGPRLLHELLVQGVVDELATTIVPRLVAGSGPRIVQGQPIDVPLDLRLLLEMDGTLLGRWFVRR